MSRWEGVGVAGEVGKAGGSVPDHGQARVRTVLFKGREESLSPPTGWISFDRCKERLLNQPFYKCLTHNCTFYHQNCIHRYMDHRTLQGWLKNEDICWETGNVLPKPPTEFQASTNTPIYLKPHAKEDSLVTLTRGARGCKHCRHSCYSCHVTGVIAWKYS